MMGLGPSNKHQDAIIGQDGIADYHASSEDSNDLLDCFNDLSLSESCKERQPEVPFDQQRCLFCAFRTSDLEANLDHMLQEHGFSIPEEPSLIVDIETLVRYCHLIIYGYFECLSCGSQRHSAEAARQHMVGRRHCSIDVYGEDSEFRDFYEFDSSSEATTGEGEDESTASGHRRDDCVEVDDALRLPSGKLLSRRPHASLRLQRKASETRKKLLPPASTDSQYSAFGFPVSEEDGSSMPNTGSEPSKRIAKHEANFRSQLVGLSSEDRRSLMHLPLSKQRALVMKSKKQVEQARRQENEMLLKIQLKANGNR